MSIEEIKDLQTVDKIEDYYKVSKSNILIDSAYSLSANEQKVLLTAISLINPEDNDFKPYRVSVSAIREILGITNNSFYNQIKGMTENIINNSFTYKDTESKRQLQVPSWFATCEYFDGEGVIEFEFSPKVKRLLLQLRKNFTSYMLSYAVKLKSKYSIRIYEILKKIENMKSVVFYIDEIKNILSIDSQYKQYNHFKINVLEKARKEINKSTDIRFSYKELKTGRKIDRIKFNVSKNKQNIKQKDKIDLFELNETGYKLINYNVSQYKAREIMKGYQEEYIQERIKQFEFELKNNIDKINEIGKGKYLFNLIKHKDWVNDKYEEHKKELLRKAKEKEERAEKMGLKRLVKEYEKYIDTFVKSYDDLEIEQQKIIDNVVNKEYSKYIGNKVWKENTLNDLRKELIDEAIRNEIIKELPSFEEWLREQ